MKPTKKERLQLRQYERTQLHRSCGTCTLCCKLMSIYLDDGSESSDGRYCRHCDVNVGCRIYQDRPLECRIWACNWRRRDAAVPEAMRPDKVGFVVHYNRNHDGGDTFVISIDDDWRERP